jgi:mannose-6-phosphate isomerase-like protein (cupin superfamily)
MSDRLANNLMIFLEKKIIIVFNIDMILFYQIFNFILSISLLIGICNSYPHHSTPYHPSYQMPIQCENKVVRKYISDLENGIMTFDTIQPNDGYCLTMMGNETIKVNCTMDQAHVGYIWKQLWDEPHVIGVTKGQRSDHKPHFHREAECYYVINGTTCALIDSAYRPLHKSHYLYIPPSTIHNQPIQHNDDFGVLYWFPNDGNFSSFKYYYIDDVYGTKSEEVFEYVDELRLRHLDLPPYTSPYPYPSNKTGCDYGD